MIARTTAQRAMREPLVYFNGQFLPQSEARLTWHDAGFVMGVAVTDLCRTVRRKLYRWPDHLARFLQSAALAQVPVEADEGQLTQVAEELVEHNVRLVPAGGDLALVVFATPGPVGYYLGEPGDGPPSLGMHTFRLPLPRHKFLFEHGARLALVEAHCVPGAALDPRIKQRSRMTWWVAGRAALARHPGSVALLLDDAGCVTETAAANVLLVLDGVVCSPPLDRILNGVSLRVVEELCGQLKIPFAYRPLPREEIARASEVLLTNTCFCIAGASAVDDRPFPHPGPMLTRLRERWSHAIDLDIADQVLNFGP